MVAAVKFPPSHRDFEVHRFLTAEGGTTRAAAVTLAFRRLGCGSFRSGWSIGPRKCCRPVADADNAGRLWVAEAAACDRLQHFYEQTMEQWRASHQPKFLGLAIRVTLAAAKLPCRTFAIEAAAADLLEESEGSEVGSQESGVEEPRPRAQSTGPPAKDCSEKSESNVDGSVSWATPSASQLRPARAS